MKIIEKWWIVALLGASLFAAAESYACGGDDVVNPETVETPTFEFRL